ncbi:MAG: 50S ribosomal protein L25 [Acidobacteria bacterium]|nr:50S ribosomal protein L25 [Acidobacteriota bacterium]
MRKDITIAAAPRATRGKNEARRLRVAGSMPAVIYGTGKDPVAVAVSPKEVSKILHSSTGHNTIFDVAVEGGAGEPVMIVDWQVHPIKGGLLHVDMQRIDLDKAIVVQVPVHVKGEARGVKIQGGLLELVNREVSIECLPNDIPEFFEVDVTGLGLNQAVRAGDLTLSASMVLIEAPDAVLVHVTALKAEAAPADAAAAGPAEPEVVKAKGKKEEAAPADDKKKK